MPYFHVVFTVPATLNRVIWWNQRLLFNLLFQAVSRTLMAVAQNPRLLGAEIGFICILHTWGQKLAAHPHIHCIVTGGGLRGDRWIAARENFFLPVKVLSRLFRGKFLAGLRGHMGAGRLVFPTEADPTLLIAEAYRKEWVVYCKEPFRKPDALIGYLGRYTHRIAITNSRLLDFDGETVTFQYRDYSRNNRQDVLRLPADEFIRRFLLHVLPARFVKIRHYGLLANRKIERAIRACREALSATAPPPPRRNRMTLKGLTGGLS